MAADRVVHPPTLPDEERIDFFGVFASPAVERAFREQRERDDRWWRSFLIAAGTLRVAVFLLADYRSFDSSSAFWLLGAGRLLFCLISVWTLIALRRDRTAVRADRLFFGWGLLIVAMTSCALLARPSDDHALLFMSFSVVLVGYCVMPLPLLRQGTLALAFSAAVVHVAGRADGTTLAMVAGVHAMAHLFGAVTSWRLNHRRREIFLGTLREAKLRANLEAALAEVRTLRGLLCVCAWCKRVQHNEGWQPLEIYVRDRTEASFSHGICPDCLQSQQQELARLRG